MAKSKKSPALFEVLENTQNSKKDDLKVPAWWSRQQQEAAAGKAESDSPPAVSPPAPPSQEGAIRMGPPATPPARVVRESEATPLVDMQAGRLNVSLSLVGAALFLGVVLLLLAGAYELGESRGFDQGLADARRAFPGSVESTRQQPVNPDLVSDLRVDGSGRELAGTSPNAADDDAARSEDHHRWVRGNTYVIVQVFMADAGNAPYVAQGFFAENDLNTVTVEQPSGKILLITADGYDYSIADQKAAGKRLLRKVQKIGRLYQRAGGEYSCQGFEATYTADAW